MKNKSALNVFESYQDFVSSLNNTIFEETSAGGATVTPLGDTGISAVTFPKEGTSFGGDADTKPYILLRDSGVEFQAYTKMDNQTVTVILTDDTFDKPGVYKKIDKAGTSNESFISPGLSLDFPSAIRVLSSASNALFGAVGGVTADKIKKTAKAIKIIKTDFPTEIEKNKLFASLYKQITIINSKNKVEDLKPLLGSTRATGDEKAIFDGIKEAFKA